MKKIISGIIFSICTLLASAQCNNQLAAQAAELAGNDALFIRDFKVRLKAGTMKKPSPIDKFTVYLNEGVHYRFTLASDTNNSSKTHVELARKGQTLVGNNVSKGNTKTKFDYECSHSGIFNLYASFGKGKPGCAFVVMSMVLQDSMNFIEPELAQFDTNNVLLLWAENKVQIASTKGKDADIEVEVSQGSITKNGKFFYITPEQEGQLLVFTSVFAGDGQLLEQDTGMYEVLKPPLPKLVIKGEHSGYLSATYLNNLLEVELENEYFDKDGEAVYTLKSFEIAASLHSVQTILSDGEYLSHRQVQALEVLLTGERFYIINPVFIAPNDQRFTGISREIIID